MSKNQTFISGNKYSDIKHLADRTRGISYEAIRYDFVMAKVKRDLTAQNMFFNLILEYRAGNGKAYSNLDNLLDYCATLYNGSFNWRNDSIHESLKDKVWDVIKNMA